MCRMMEKRSLLHDCNAMMPCNNKLPSYECCFAIEVRGFGEIWRTIALSTAPKKCRAMAVILVLVVAALLSRTDAPLIASCT